ncbi:MAG: hypothetical protein K2M13_06105 [Muribaculaceae bacterium]|nr:hypothetical protein [Muribaculaceae bacterium]
MSKIENDKYNELRSLLGKWYEGAASPQEEADISAMLTDADSLPPDLEADRDLFMTMTDALEDLPEIPEQYSLRINAALEKEIVADKKEIANVGAKSEDAKRRAGNRIGGFLRSGLFRWTATGVAVCLAGIFITNRMMEIPAIDMPVQKSGVAMNIAVPAQQADTLIHSISLVKDNKVNVDGNRECLKRGEGRKTIIKKATRKSEYHEENHEDPYLTREEEEMLIAHNYTVIRDEGEAARKLNHIFGGLESNIMDEMSNLRRIETEYQSEVGNNLMSANLEYFESNQYETTE